MSGGGGSPISRVIGQMGEANRGSEQGASYTPITPNVYGSAFNSQQTAQAPQTSVSPIVQQMAQRIQAQNTPFSLGLQNLYGAMQQQMPMQMPTYQNPALAYRPNMAQAQQSLTRVQPSVYKTDLDTARARIAELEGQSGGYE